MWHPSPIQTLTVGSGISPGSAAGTNPLARGLYRRWGLSPRPEGCLQLGLDLSPNGPLAQEDELLGLDRPIRLEPEEIGPARELPAPVVRAVPAHLVLAGRHGLVREGPDPRPGDVEDVDPDARGTREGVADRGERVERVGRRVVKARPRRGRGLGRVLDTGRDVTGGNLELPDDRPVEEVVQPRRARHRAQAEA